MFETPGLNLLANKYTDAAVEQECGLLNLFIFPRTNILDTSF
jgi:hypothetical protein